MNNFSLNDLLPLTSRLDTLLSGSVSVVLAMDGRAASGKSSLAGRLARDYGGRLVHMDDFFLPQELRTSERQSEPGGNVHYERFISEILPGIRNKAGFSYQTFDCKQMQLGEWRNLAPAHLTVVEGAYALHPKLGKCYDLSLFLSCPPETQLARIEAREASRLEEFKKHWIPLEEAYFHAFGIPECADYIIQA